MFKCCRIIHILTSYTFYLGVAGKAWWTATLFNVTSDFALGIYAADSSYVARI